MKKICDTILDTIGHTPMVRINSLARDLQPATMLQGRIIGFGANVKW